MANSFSLFESEPSQVFMRFGVPLSGDHTAPPSSRYLHFLNSCELLNLKEEKRVMDVSVTVL